MRKPWTPEEDAYLREHYHTRGSKHCAEALDRTVTATRHRSKRLRRGQAKSRTPPTERTAARMPDGLSARLPQGLRHALERAITDHPQLGAYLANPTEVVVMPDATHYE